MELIHSNLFRTMRHQEVSESSYFSADITGLFMEGYVAIIPISNSNGDKLDLQISILSNGKARVKVLEKNHNRYELTDVLDREFPAVRFV